jgi:hypothetical protein
VCGQPVLFGVSVEGTPVLDATEVLQAGLAPFDDGMQVRTA